MKMMKKKITFGLIVATRNIFNAQLAKQGRKQLLKVIKKLRFDYVITPEIQGFRQSLQGTRFT